MPHDVNPHHGFSMFAETRFDEAGERFAAEHARQMAHLRDTPNMLLE